MLNEVYPEIRAAQQEAISQGKMAPRTVAGETGPFKHLLTNTAPLAFMRALVCIYPACSRQTSFDIWAHHPYTLGSPWHHSTERDGVSLADLGKMHSLIVYAAQHHKTRSLALFPQRLWVTEFTWDSNPPDPGGVPALLHARWIAEALYVARQASVTQFTWFDLRDRPYPTSYWQSGLYRCDLESPKCSKIDNDIPKLGLGAFKFPFVAYRRSRGVYIWGRTPWGQHGVIVTIARRTAGGWPTVARVRTNVYGIFSGTVRTSLRTGTWRASATFGGQTYRSVGFSLVPPRNENMTMSNPFGCGGGLC
jgi:hypothetical protein